MADEDLLAFDHAGAELFRRIGVDYLAGRLTNRPLTDEARRTPRGRSSLRAAVAPAGGIGPGATAAVELVDSAWETTGETLDATNDADSTIAAGTKLYIGRVSPLSGWRVIEGAGGCPGPGYILALYGNPVTANVTLSVTHAVHGTSTITLDATSDSAAAVRTWLVALGFDSAGLNVTGGSLRNVSLNVAARGQGDFTMAITSATYTGGIVPYAYLFRAMDYVP